MALLDALMEERLDDRLVHLPPDGAALDDIEKAALLAALRRARWVQKDAAALLRISPRVMTYKVQLHGIVPPDGYGAGWKVRR